MLSAFQGRMNDIALAAQTIEDKIYLIRGQRVMLDHDLAALYGVTTKRLNEQVRRNTERFPVDFCFILSDQELTDLRSQIATANLAWNMRRVQPLAFTEQGVAMLSAVLRSPQAVAVSIAIVRVFVKLKSVLKSDSEFENRIMALEKKFDGQFRKVFDAIRALASEREIPRKRIVGLDPNDT